MNWVYQIVMITSMNLRNLPARIGPSMVIVVGIAGVVTVLVALLAMAQGFESTLNGTGRTDRVVILRGGSNNEMSSFLSNREAQVIATKPGIRRDEQGPLLAGEIYLINDIKKRGNLSAANLPMRGVEQASFRVRDEVRIIEGRSIEFGKFELIAGRGAADQFVGLDVGNEVIMRSETWKVVGIFSSSGDVHESEVWVDTRILEGTLNRGGGFSSMVARLTSDEDFEVLKKAIEDDPRLETKIVREVDYYSEQSEGLTQLITQFGYSVATIMAIGAIFGALNTMYSAVSTRSVEIATLRALGFSNGPVVFSVLVESLLLAFIGGALGALIAYLWFNGYTVSTMNISTFSQVSFDFVVTPALLQKGIIWASLLGLAGGLFPAIRAVRQPITIALRGR